MFIAGAETLRYGDIMAVIDAAMGAGVEKVGIVTAGMRKAAGVAGNFKSVPIGSPANGRPHGRPFCFSGASRSRRHAVMLQGSQRRP
ncbi:MAG: hypothetical protein QM736_29155 [Vicinamibacterales bacterium]